MRNGHYFEANNFGYSYPGPLEWVLNDLDFNFFAGEKVLISGKSGAGKTTLLYAMQGIVPGILGGRTRGRLQFSCRSGLALQNPDTALIAPTVREELIFAANHSLQAGNYEYLIGETAESLDISHLLDRETTRLSTGEKQKVVIAAILIGGPEVVMLDDPLSHLDDNAGAAFNDILENLAGDDRLIVIATNRPAPSSNTFSKIITLSNGDDLSNGGVALSVGLKAPGESVLKASGIKLADDAGAGILKGIDLELRMGELATLIGANGSGKSSLLKVIAGLWKPGSGKIERVKGKSLGYLPQNPEQLLFCRTVAEEIGYSIKGQTTKPERIRQLARDLNISHLLDSSPHRLSLGQKQMVAIASILAPQPDIILLDEPAAHLDAKASHAAWAALCAEAQRGAAILVTGHNDQENGPCHRAIRMRNGEISQAEMMN